MNLDKLKKELEQCRLCEEKFGFRPNPVYFGNQNVKIMHISQAPSKNVHLTKKSFNDISGQKLKYEWYQITDEDFYNPNNFYITSVGHCYPGKNRKGRDNKPPKICRDIWLKKEIELVNCQLYVIVGKEAADFLFPKSNFKELVFNNNIFNNKIALVLPHPSPVNIKWFLDNPEFEKTRIIEIRAIIKEVLQL